ncbi:GntR family transcriptional regulator [Microbacteriaceae bacterium MWH-Ta3]|nr:GntR family transcriptional regulator [Microbacteriaceae bacterium MWH-Ta3]
MADESDALTLDIFAGLDRSGPIPLYFQVSQRIEQAIMDGTLPAGARLENEVSLGERLRLSRPTIRRAIQDLVDKGLLVRRRGIGTQVVHGRVTRGVELTSLYEDLQQSGQKPSTRILSVEVVKATELLADRLAVPEGAAVLHVKRVRLADNVPVSVLENWLPTEFTDITARELETAGLYEILRARGVTIRVAKQRIAARTATTDDSLLLDIDKHSALITMERTAFDSSGKAIEFGSHCYRPDLYSFEVTLVEK